MIIYMPASFKANLKLDDSKHFVIDMNSAWRGICCEGEGEAEWAT